MQAAKVGLQCGIIAKSVIGIVQFKKHVYF